MHRILLASNNTHKLNKLRGYLNMPDVECESVLDVGSAERALACRCQDVIVLDSALMPANNSEKIYDTIDSLKSASDSIRIVIFNGVSNRTVQRRIRRRGANGYLSSKNNMKKVAESVKKLL